MAGGKEGRKLAGTHFTAEQWRRERKEKAKEFIGLEELRIPTCAPLCSAPQPTSPNLQSNLMTMSVRNNVTVH